MDSRGTAVPHFAAKYNLLHSKVKEAVVNSLPETVISSRRVERVLLSALWLVDKVREEVWQKFNFPDPIQIQQR